MDLLTGYLIGMNAVTFVLYAVDKLKARAGAWRISENALMLLAAVGGSVGALLAMLVCRHKIRTPKFKFGIPAIIMVQAVLIYTAGGF